MFKAVTIMRLESEEVRGWMVRICGSQEILRIWDSFTVDGDTIIMGGNGRIMGGNGRIMGGKAVLHWKGCLMTAFQ